jgi:hypothetical protein
MPADVPTVKVYAGDTNLWPVYVIKDLDNNPRNLVAEGWTDWQAQWRVDDTDTNALPLVVDVSRTDEGMLMIYATPEVSRAMGSNGIWDIQAVNDEQVKTWLRGKTKWVEDVTRA